MRIFESVDLTITRLLGLDIHISRYFCTMVRFIIFVPVFFLSLCPLIFDQFEWNLKYIRKIIDHFCTLFEFQSSILCSRKFSVLVHILFNNYTDK